MGSLPQSCLVIPCFNEAERLPVDEFVAFADAHPETTLLFVDDGSTDSTVDLLNDMAGSSSSSHIMLLTLPRNIGKAGAIHAGLLEGLQADPEIIGYLDSDLATSLEEMSRLLLECQSSGADAVLGSRVALAGHQVRRSFARHYLGRIFATLASLVLGFPIYDTQCGAKAFRATPALKRALAEPFRTRWVFDVELLLRLRELSPQSTVLEMPLHEWSDVGGSKLTAGRMAEAFLDLCSLGVRQVIKRRLASRRRFATAGVDQYPSHPTEEPRAPEPTAQGPESGT